MDTPERLESLDRAVLLTWVAALRRQVAELTASNAALRAEIEPLTRGGKRPAAPFSKGTRVAEPKPSGRKPGSGTFSSRAAPPPEAMTAPSVDVQVTVDACPTCGGPVVEERVDWASITEIAAIPRPKVTQYRVWVCRCTVCGTHVRGQHPDLAPDPSGATAHRLGPRVLAAAHALHDGVGIPVRQVPAVLAALTGVSLTQGVLTQEALRRAAGAVGTVDEQLRAAVPAAPVVHTDDTGWRVGGEPADLLACETDATSVDQMRPRHRHAEVQEVMPANDAGVMVTDRGRRDDAQAVDRVDQPKCLAHMLRSISTVVETKTGRARDFGDQLKARLQEALARWHQPRGGHGTDWQVDAEALQAAITYQLRDRRLNDPDHQRLLNELGWPHDRGNVRRFLADPRMEPTNNRAERALCPAVIARNVSHGSKTDAGAHTFAAFTSVVRTLAKHGSDALVEGLYHLCRSPNLQSIAP